MGITKSEIKTWVKVPVHEGGWPEEHRHAIHSDEHCRTCAGPVDDLADPPITLDWGSKGNPDDIDVFCSSKCCAEHVINIELGDTLSRPKGPMALPKWKVKGSDG